MADAMLAGLPRLVRVADETRWRGQSAVALALSVACYWTVAWLLDGPVAPGQAFASAGTALLAALIGAGLISRARLGALGAVRRPPRPVVYETLADGRERRTRASGIVLMGTVVLLVFDRLSGDGGIMAGLMVGIGLGIGLVDRLEARRWAAAERARDSRLFLLLRPHALLARYAGMEVYEEPRPDPDRTPAPSGLPG
ncbi:MAG: hypothetical protein MUE51_09420 [Thermoleophilia bacterium]|jgi:hypothetical protein|nr:hypothetical protein [Thermoleophilia bacterium]